MNEKSLHLIPRPRQIELRRGIFELNERTLLAVAAQGQLCLLPAQQVQEEVQRVCGWRLAFVAFVPAERCTIRLIITGRGKSEGYRLEITSEGITLEGNDEAGLYYGVQTLRQLIRQCGKDLPCIQLVDEPEFTVRGFYHDLSRGKIPRLETLFGLVERLAHYKINQLQLYVEHVFAFERHPEICAGTDPLTAEDILRLDAHCRMHHIELVPSLSTFGHCYHVIRHQRHCALNELELDATERDFSFRDTMAHYTLNPTDERAVQLMSELIEEFAPLFSSGWFNICCDETFDLGIGHSKGAVAAQGAGAVYMGYVNRICEAVKAQGKHPQFWGDILLKHPEAADRCPEHAIVLNWNYAADIDESDCQSLAALGQPWFVCPGVQGWRLWSYDLNTAALNISRFIRAGHQHGAVGVLVTDWGDIGHPNMLSGSYYGMALAAAMSWNLDSVPGEDFTEFDRSFSRLELGDDGGQVVAWLRDVAAQQLVRWGDVSMWRDTSPDVPAAWRDEQTRFPQAILAIKTAEFNAAHEMLSLVMKQLRAHHRAWDPQEHLLKEECIQGIRGAQLMLEIGMIMKRHACGDEFDIELDEAVVADRVRCLEREQRRLWHLRNRPSAYFRLQEELLGVAEELDRLKRKREQ